MVKEQDIDEELAVAEKTLNLANQRADVEVAEAAQLASFFLLRALLKEVALLRQDLARTGVSRS